ncbi:MAG: hypothetical protein M3463_22640, partial [Verrucomicrobiota bacterium]|nr:hypothetical protein [Verrucomicrobiota bacterium]
ALSALRGSRRIAAWAVLLAPALTPPIVVGYAFTRGVLAGGARGLWSEALYALLVLGKLVPVATVALALVPPLVTPAGRHCFHLQGPHSIEREWRFRIRAAGPAPAIALALVFLLAFPEFQLAAFYNVRTWTVVLFDQHAGGLPLADSLRFAALPVIVEALVLALFWLALRGAGTAVAPRIESSAALMSAPGMAYLACAALFITALPMLRLARQAGPGFQSLVDTFGLGTELAASMVFSLGASVAAWLLAGCCASRVRAATMGLPGLFGALVVSLLVLTLFQLSALRPVYDSPLPLLLALTLLLLPLAIMLRWFLDAIRPDNALFIASQLGHRELLWRLEGRRRFAAWALLFCWAFFDFTAASILAPVGFTPVFVRLHNLMHYGQAAVLSAMVCTAFATPVAVLLLAGAAARFLARHHGR